MLTFGGLLQVALIVLKLVEVINWSWWWVLFPTWAEIVVCIIYVVIKCREDL